MRASFLPLHLALTAAVALLLGGTARADGDVTVLIVKEHGIGSAAQAQPYVDKLVAVAAKHNGWSSARGKYLTSRARAQAYIGAESPQYGILSLGAFLALRKPQSLTVVGQAAVARAGGRQYHFISAQAASLDECKGKSLASNHANHRRFIDRVVSGGKFTLDEFTLVEARRPVQTIKKVARGQAVCALVDDAQLRELPNVQGAEGIRAVWSSAKLPPMAVVAFPNTSGGERNKFQASLSLICTGDGKSSCDKVGIQSLTAASESSYAAVIRAYGE